MYLQPWSLLYGWIHKAASTSWNKIFFQLAREKVKDTNLHEAAAFFKPQKEMLERIFNDSVSFTFVRHPFERLVSAFRDKFETGSKKNWIYTKPQNIDSMISWCFDLGRYNVDIKYPTQQDIESVYSVITTIKDEKRN